MADKNWKGPGYCKMRSVRVKDDYCNQPVVKRGEYCSDHTCIIRRCKAKATVWYPMLPGNPRFCDKHHKPRYAEQYGCDFSGPDDFDIPF